MPRPYSRDGAAQADGAGEGQGVKILLVHPGASWATADVHQGIEAALKAAGVEVISFALDSRLEASGGYLTWVWKHAHGKLPKMTQADIMYHASTGIIERALRHAVDWVLIVCHMYVHPDVLVMLARAGLRVAIIFTESPYDDEAQIRLAPWARAVWVNERASVDKFRRVQPRSYYWQHAIDPARHVGAAQPGDEDWPAHDVVFVATGFQERCDALSAMDWTGIDFGLYGSWPLLGSRSKLRRYWRDEVVPNAVTAALYRRAKIGLNIHRSSKGFGKGAPRVEGAESMGPRCYELAACGLFFISDWRAEMDDVFGGLVPTFRTPAEAEALLRAYLSAPEERQAIARQLPAKVAAETFASRVAGVLRVLEEAM